MKRIAIGMLIGLAIGAGGMAAASALVTRVPARGIAFVADPGKDATLIHFQNIDAVCVYVRLSGPGPEKNLKSEPQLQCGRGPFPSGWNTSRRLFITPYRFFVMNGAGDITYTVTRAP
jgi:hypothetical protein